MMKISKPFTAALALVGTLVSTSQATALERPGNVEYAWEGQEGPWANGLYIVGDSISWGVPYGPTGTSLGVHTWWRAGLGWSTYGHNHTLWGQSQLTSIQDALRSPAKTVFIELGTNDVNCMAPGGLCFDAPTTEEQRTNERWKMIAEVVSVAQQLVNGGKCVVWAGTREIDRPTAPLAEAAAWNQLLRSVQNMYPGKFFYADYNAFSFQNADLNSSLDGPGGDRIHPQSVAARQAVANFAFWYSVFYCGLAP